MARVTVTPSADADFEHILAYLNAHAGYQVAEKYLAALVQLYDNLAYFPYSGSPRPKLGTNIRIGFVFPYIVIYRCYDEEDLVRILRIVHGSRRITGRLLKGVS